MVFTQDGRVAKRLIGSDSEVEKEYLVRVEGTIAENGLELLQHGMELDGVKLKPARVSWANEDQLRFVLREGRKRNHGSLSLLGRRRRQVLVKRGVWQGAVTMGDWSLVSCWCSPRSPTGWPR